VLYRKQQVQWVQFFWLVFAAVAALRIGFEGCLLILDVLPSISLRPAFFVPGFVNAEILSRNCLFELIVVPQSM